MKHIFQIFFFSFIVCCLPQLTFASITKADIPDSCIVFTPSNDFISKTIFNYNEDYFLTEKSTFSWDNNIADWLATFKTTYLYDDSGKLISEIGTQYTKEEDSPTTFYKSAYTYTENNNIETQEFYNRETDDQQLKGVYKYEYTYNSNLKPTGVIEYGNYDTQTNSWIATKKFIYDYSYDSIQSLTEIYNYNTKTNQWIKESKNEKIYNDAGQLEREENYIGQTNVWKPYSRTQNEYIDGKISASTKSKSNGTTWIEFSKTSFQYNDSKSSATTAIYDTISASWNKAFKDSICYLSNSNIEKSTSSMWNKTLSQWDKISQIIYDYSDGRESASYVFSPKKGWIGIGKRGVSYNNAGNIIKDEKYVWNEKDSLWSPASKTEHTYINDSLIASTIQYSLGEENSWNAYKKNEHEYDTLTDSSIGLTILTNFEFINSTWEEIKHTQFYYPQKSPSSQEINRATNAIAIKWTPQRIEIATDKEINRVIVYYINGVQKYDGKSKQIPTSGWKKGVYIVQVKTANNNLISKKINVR